MWKIPGDTTGLKRGAGRQQINHLVHITPAIEAVLEQLKIINGNYNWAFYSPRGKKYHHTNPSSINKRLRDNVGAINRTRGRTTAKPSKMNQSMGYGMCRTPFIIVCRC